MKNVSLLLVLFISLTALGCATSAQFTTGSGATIYWPPRSGLEVKVVNNVAETCMIPDFAGVSVPLDIVPTGRYCTGQVATFFFTVDPWVDRSRTEILFRFFSDDEEGNYVGSETVSVHIPNRIGERSSSVREIDYVRRPRQP